MSTEQDLHQAFVDYLTTYLTTCPPLDVEPKIIEWVARFLEKKEFDSIPNVAAGSQEEKAIDKIKKQHGVE